MARLKSFHKTKYKWKNILKMFIVVYDLINYISNLFCIMIFIDI